MSSRKPRTRAASAPDPEESPEPVEPVQEPANGTTVAEETEETPVVAHPEEAADVELKIKGTDRAARAAAKRFGEGAVKMIPTVTTPANDAGDEGVDEVGRLLSDGKNMVIVTRQKPRTVQGPDGTEHATNVRIPGRYTCPTSQQEIEELVFEQHGGSKYKCTIHPDTPGGENKILGHFTIEHQDPKCPPFISGVTIDLPPEPEPEMEIPTKGDPTMRETDTLAQMRQSLQRRFERAQMKKEIEELEAQVREIEGKKEAPAAPVASAENEELRKLREQNAQLAAQLSEKKVNDRFDKLESSIASLAEAVTRIATAPPKAASEEGSLVKTMLASQEKMFAQAQQHSKDMLELVKGQSSTKGSGTDDFDKILDRMTKLQTITGAAGGGGKSGRLSELENKLIDMSFDRLVSGGGGDDEDSVEDVEDAVKLAIKQFAPIAKTYVEKKMDQEQQATGGAKPSEEVIQRIQTEAAQAAAKKVQADLALQGLQLAQDQSGRLIALQMPKKPVVPPRHLQKETVEAGKSAEGTTRIVNVKPEKKPAAAPKPTPAPAQEEEIVQAEFPGLGPNGSVFKVDIPAPPGDLKYDRKTNVNFILDAIRSEIVQKIPKERPDDSFVIGDAMELLDDEILAKIAVVETGDQMEKILGEWGDPVRVTEIKSAGNDEDVKAWLRRLVLSIGDAWRNRGK